MGGNHKQYPLLYQFLSSPIHIHFDSIDSDISPLQFVIPGFELESSVFLDSCFRRNDVLCRD